MNAMTKSHMPLTKIEAELATIQRRVNKDQWRTAELLADARDGHFADDPDGFDAWMRSRITKNLANRWLKVFDRFASYETVTAVMHSEKPIDFSKLEELQGCEDSQVVKQYVRKLTGPNPPTQQDIRQGIKALREPAPTPAPDFKEGVSELKKVVVDALPKGTNKRAVDAAAKGVEQLAGRLHKDFDKAVETKTKVQRENLKKAQAKAEEQQQRAIKMKAGVKAFMTKSEFMLVRKCLHPDTNPHPKASEAFAIFNRLADVKKW